MTRSGLLEALRGLATLDVLRDDQRRLAAESGKKLEDQVVYVAVIGEFKRGKSSLINALVGGALLPTGVIPVTAAPTLVQYGEAARATVRYLDDREQAVSLSELADFITELGNPGNRRRVREAVVQYPAPLLRTGLVLADTPGTGSLHASNTEMTSSFMPRVDVALLVLTVDAPLSSAEANLLAAAGRTVARAAVCLNKVDLLTPQELEDAVGFVTERVAAVHANPPIPVFPISTRRSGDAAASGLESVHRFLHGIALGERGVVVHRRARRVAEDLLQVADAAVRLERAAACQPAESADAARRAFSLARSELERGATEAVDLVLAACRRTEGEVVRPRADALRSSHRGQLLASPDEEWSELSEQAASTWMATVESELSERIAAALASHGDRLQQRLEDFVRRAGEAFDVALPPPPDIRQQLRMPRVRIETAEVPGALAMGVRQARALLPGRLGTRWREAARQRQAEEDADRLAGRVSFAALKAVDRAGRDWAVQVESGWRSLSDAMAAAVTRAERAAGDAVESPSLAVATRSLSAIRSRLGETSPSGSEGRQTLAAIRTVQQEPSRPRTAPTGGTGRAVK